jgi:hypothetical protein
MAEEAVYTLLCQELFRTRPKAVYAHIFLTSMNIYAHSLPLYISVSKKLDWRILRWRRTSYTAQ